MTIYNYWWLLIWILGAGAFLYVTFPKEKVIQYGKTEERWSWQATMILALPYLIWAGFRSDYFGDTYAYRKTFFEAPDALGQILPYISIHEKDRGFSVIMILFKSIFGNSDVLFFLVIATIQMLCIVSVFRKYSSDYWISLFLFIASTDYLSWMHNGMRQFLAVTIIFACFGWMIQKKYVQLIAVILLASTIHGSALIMLPIVFIVQGKAWNKKTVVVIVLFLLAIAFVGKFTNILDGLLADTQYMNVVSDWQMRKDDGTNPIRVFIYAIPTILSLIGLTHIKEANDNVINLACNMGIMSTMLYCLSTVTSGIFIGRLPIYCSMYATGILLPWELDHIFTDESAKIMKIFLVIGFAGFYYYQIHFTWGLI